MKSLGLDLSIRATGYCLIDGEAVRSGIVASEKGSFLGEGELVRRVEIISSTICKLVKEFAPRVVTIEGYAMQGKGRVFDLAELGGVVKNKIYYQTFDGYRPKILLASPSSAKAFAGNGKADKHQMAQYALEYGQEFSNDNECDAFFLALIGLMHSKHKFTRGGIPYEWSKKQATTLKGIGVISQEMMPRTRLP